MTSLHTLQTTNGCERQVRFEALDQLAPNPDLVVLDRGFPDIELIAAFSQAYRERC